MSVAPNTVTQEPLPTSDLSIGELELTIETVKRLPDQPVLQLTPVDCTQNTACNCDWWSSFGTFLASCCEPMA